MSDKIDFLIEVAVAGGVVVCFLLGAILGHSVSGGNRKI